MKNKNSALTVILILVIIVLVGVLVSNKSGGSLGSQQQAAGNSPFDPVVKSFTTPAVVNTLSVPITSFTAVDDSGFIAGYMITRGMRPSKNDAGWSSIPPITFMLNKSDDGKNLSLNAYVIDADGRISNPRSAGFSVSLSGGAPDTTSPLVSVISPIDGSTVSGTVQFPVNATDNVGVKNVYFYADNGAINIGSCTTGQSCNAGSKYTVSWNTSTLASGTHWLTVQAYDVAGNEGEQWISVNLAGGGNSDTIAPVTTFSPATGMATTPPVTRNLSCIDNAGGTGCKNTYWTFVTSGMNCPVQGVGYTMGTFATWSSVGMWRMCAYSVDMAGNAEQTKFTEPFVIINSTDTTAPIVTSFTMPASSPSFTVPITSFTATDNVGVTKYIASNAAGKAWLPPLTDPRWTTTPPTSYTFSAIGANSVAGWVADAAGNISAGVWATVNIAIVDNNPPVISLVQANMKTSTSAQVAWSTDPKLTTGYAEYTATPGGPYSAPINAVMYPYMTKVNAANLTGLTPNTIYYYRVTARDVSGNTATSSEYSFTTKP